MISKDREVSDSESFPPWFAAEQGDWKDRRLSPNLGYVVFELQKLPDFSEPRFVDLGEKLDDRKAEVARRQMQMLRQLHSLGQDYGLALRLCRDGDRLRLFVIVRLATARPIPAEETGRLASRVQHMFPKEYNLRQITYENHPECWNQALDLSWATYIDELIKPESTYPANTWPFFYVVSLFQSQMLNDQEHMCRTLVRYDGEAMIEIALVPTRLHPLERDWLNTCTRIMREALSGERLYNSQGRQIKTYDPLPGLRTPLENYEDLLKRYDQTQLFLYAFRVYASEHPFSITQALAASATRSSPQITNLEAQDVLFQTQLRAGQAVMVAPEIHSPWWDESGERPGRAQRLHRLADLDEVSSFWRFPIPVQAGFPGFELDTGLSRPDEELRERRVVQLNMGTIADDPGKAQLAATFDREGLAKHALLVGVPGSGKTTAMFNILQQLWAPEELQDRIPFMVLEPAKTEYRALKTVRPFLDDMFVFTLGDERISPFRLNPFDVPCGIALESHIARLNACFVGAFNLFDPLPLLLDKAIRETYENMGWFDDSIGGDPGLVTPTLGDLCRQADEVINRSGYSDKLRDDFNAALTLRLESLRRGSKGRMLDTNASIPFDLLMSRPVVLELDALNEDEKALLMMFILTFVYEYAKATRRSGSRLRHVLLVEEAHNLIGRGDQSASEFRANPKEQAIRLFVRMLAEMRALGQGILIADQLPTALAPEAMKQTNLKVLMRMTAMDDRLEIGNTMDLNEAQLKDVVHFTSGQAYVFTEEWDRVRRIQMPNIKAQYEIEIPQNDEAVAQVMAPFEVEMPSLFMPFSECSLGCQTCNRRVRSLVERFIRPMVDPYCHQYLGNLVLQEYGSQTTACAIAQVRAEELAHKIVQQYGRVAPEFPFCFYVHLLHFAPEAFLDCQNDVEGCKCKAVGHSALFAAMLELGQRLATQVGSS